MTYFRRYRLNAIALLVLLLFVLLVPSTKAQCTVVNGDFETATFTGWTKYARSQNIGDWYIYSGTVSPISNYPIAAPLGTRAAVTDHNAPTTHELYQDVTIPAGQSTLTYYMAYNNTNGYFVTLNTLDWVNNQQFRADIIKTTTANESIASPDILVPLYRSHPGDPLVISPHNRYFYDTSSLAGQTVRIRFAAAVGLSYFPISIDNVCVSAGLNSYVRTTPTGSNVEVNLGDVIVYYPSVTVAGNTTVQQLGTNTQTNPPVGETFTGPAYDISTTATVTTPISVCIHTPAGADRSHLRLLHKEAGIWVDLPTSKVNDSERYICGQVTSLSPFAIGVSPILPTNAPASVSGKISALDGSPVAGVTINLSGAQSRKTITDSNGDYRFENVKTDNFYTVTPSISNYHFNPDSNSFSLLANKSDAMFMAVPDPGAQENVIDSADYFVRQNYLDFLGREPDESGFNFWSDQILGCRADSACIERKRINVSAAYFLSIEAQETGGLVDRLYRASFARRPLYAEFIPDSADIARGVVVGDSDWAKQLSTNKQAFVEAWVQRPAFRAVYEGVANDAFVDALINHTRVSFGSSERASMINELNAGTLTRAAVVQQIAENSAFAAARRNEAFVMMEYFGYLRRDPDEAGYQFWLNKLNQFDGNFERAEMVKAFISSGEYRSRFSK